MFYRTRGEQDSNYNTGVIYFSSKYLKERWTCTCVYLNVHKIYYRCYKLHSCFISLLIVQLKYILASFDHTTIPFTNIFEIGIICYKNICSHFNYWSLIIFHFVFVIVPIHS